MSPSDKNTAHHPKSAAYQRIATEEAFAPPEMLDIYRKIIDKGDADPGFKPQCACPAHHALPDGP